MPSPDVRRYVDLTVFDKDPQDVFDIALAHLRQRLPEWVPREGNIEVLLLEAMAMEVAESIFAINRLPSAITEILLRLFGIHRDHGAPPAAHLRFALSGVVSADAGYLVPARTQARLHLPGGATPIVFTTTAELVLPLGASSGAVDAIGDRFTDEANNTLPGSPVDLMDSLILVDAVTVDAISVGGRHPESDNDYFSRALNRVARLQDTLVLPRHFVSFALEHPTVYRAVAIDNWNGADGDPGDHPGHVTVAVYGAGTPLTDRQMATLAADMAAISLANLDVHVIGPSITQVDVAVSVQATPGATVATVQADIEHVLAHYLNPATWNWGGTVRRNELIALVSNVAGVDYVSTLDIPAGDVTLAGHAPLADTGAVSIVVTSSST